MSLTGVIASLATPGPYMVTRRQATAYVKGRYAPGPSALVVPDDIVESVDITIDSLTLTAHGLLTGDGPFQLTTDDTLPAGLALLTDYWVVRRDDNEIKLAASLDDAMAFPEPIVVNITDVGAGTHTLEDTLDTQRQNYAVFGIVASLQPDTGRELAELPESEHGDEIAVLWTTTALQTRVPGFEPDEITRNGEIYYVHKVQIWEGLGTTHYQVWFSRTVVP